LSAAGREQEQLYEEEEEYDELDDGTPDHADDEPLNVAEIEDKDEKNFIQMLIDGGIKTWGAFRDLGNAEKIMAINKRWERDTSLRREQRDDGGSGGGGCTIC
jgi:hypothetical protein